MSKTTVIYRDIAVGADKDAEITTGHAASFSEIAELPFGISHEPVITLEPNSWLLNGTRNFRETQRLAFWSESLSDEDGAFEDAPIITINFDEQYSVMGLTFAFDPASGEYCSELNIKWYQGETLKSDKDFYPNEANYFCSNRVEVFDRIVITLKKTSKPYRRAKIDHIIFGLIRRFGMSELRSAKITNETDLVSLKVPISKFTWTLDSRSDVDFMFQLKQPVEVSNDDSIIGVYYIDEYSRNAQNIYKIQCYDAFGVLDESSFPGGAYLSGVSAKELFTEIIGGYFDILYEVEDATLYGLISPSSRREAVQQVLFAWGVCATTDGHEKIRVFSLSDSLKEIGEGNTYTGAKVTVSAIVTEVQVTAHTYTESEEDSSLEIDGVNYKDTTTVYTVSNPNVTATDKAKVMEVKNATLVSIHNGQEVAQRVYDYYMRRSTNKSKIVWNGEMLGDYVSLPTSWGGSTTGHISKMDITLSNTVAASCQAIGQ